MIVNFTQKIRTNQIDMKTHFLCQTATIMTRNVTHSSLSIITHMLISLLLPFFFLSFSFSLFNFNNFYCVLLLVLVYVTIHTCRSRRSLLFLHLLLFFFLSFIHYMHFFYSKLLI